ncbi:hypothetical protein [Hymenobacter lucidus]|uniref:Uncharacterized protein n=1 Tax=Hymenobacter lucidus TaxID=2880930 RepID=A0ABS8AZL2_9BACT|nr:hypothetical protein [Hymenobacter lucidus]MCB2411209.1 hypothetical protein [Hymenobacter lucidus]
MKLLVAFLTILLNFMSFCSNEEPKLPQLEFKVVAYQRTVDAQQRNPRLRWIIEQVPLDSLPGAGPRYFTQYKTFSLTDTLVYRPGHHFKAYWFVMSDVLQETPWKTPAEWLSVGPLPPGYTANPEVELTQVSSL